MHLTQTAKNNKVLKEVIENSWGGIGIINTHSKFIYVNQAFQPLLGYPEKELLTMKFEDILDEKYIKEFQELLIENHKNQYNNNMHAKCIRKDKAYVYLDISLNRMSNKDFIVINITDITQNISDHETFDKYVIQAHFDTQGVLVKVSEAFCRLSLFPSEYLLGKHFSSILLQSISTNHLQKKIITEIKNNNQFKGILAAHNKYEEVFYVEVIIKAIKNKYGDVLGYSAVMFDITHEINLQENTAVLTKKIGENESKLKIMGDTLRTVAHQWRQPLNTISLEAQDLLFSYQFSQEIVHKDEAVPILESMQTNIENLSGIISKFQLITELKSLKTNIKIMDIIKSTLFKSTIPASLVKINCLDDILIETYKNELETSLVAILDNAYDALVKKRVTQKDTVLYFVSLSEDKKNLCIEISNNGGHIKKDILEKIYDAYFSTKDAKNGVGLSLYIAKIIIELHLNGTIEAINEEYERVTFKVTLPIGIVKNDNNTSTLK